MNWSLEYSELMNDVDFVDKCGNLREQLLSAQNVYNNLLLLKKHYDKLPQAARIDLDLLLAFTLNSLYWISLRVKGEDLSSHPIKGELTRIKTAMVKWQQVKDREKRPTVNVAAAKRFVRNGLYDHKQNGFDMSNKKTKNDD